jgi:uncharacterized membrane protein
VALMAILAIFALPVGLPVAIAFAAVATAMFAALMAALAAFTATTVALIAGGLISAVLGVAAMTQNFALGLAETGTGFIALGLGWLLLRAAIWLWRRGIAAAARRLGRAILRKIRNRRERSKQ